MSECLNQLKIIIPGAVHSELQRHVNVAVRCVEASNDDVSLSLVIQN